MRGWSNKRDSMLRAQSCEACVLRKKSPAWMYRRASALLGGLNDAFHIEIALRGPRWPKAHNLALGHVGSACVGVRNTKDGSHPESVAATRNTHGRLATIRNKNAVKQRCHRGREGSMFGPPVMQRLSGARMLRHEPSATVFRILRWSYGVQMKSMLMALSLSVVLGATLATSAYAQDQADPIPPPPNPLVVVEATAQVPDAPGNMAPIPAPPAVTLALSPETMDPALTDRVRAFLEYRAHTSRVGSTVAGLTMIIAGAVLTGVGIGIVADNSIRSSDGFGIVFPLGATLGWILVAEGPTAAVQGIAMMAMTTPYEERSARYMSLLNDGMSPAEHAAIGGELRAEASQAHFQRLLAATSSFGLSAGGIASIVVAGVGSNLTDDDRTFGYLFGGTLVGVGVGLGILLLAIEMPQEKDWNAFQQGVPPDSYASRVHISPVASQYGGGLAMTGTF